MQFLTSKVLGAGEPALTALQAEKQRAPADIETTRDEIERFKLVSTPAAIGWTERHSRAQDSNSRRRILNSAR